jgi:hypothetical protein
MPAYDGAMGAPLAFDSSTAWTAGAIALGASLLFALLARAGRRVGSKTAARAYANSRLPALPGPAARIAFLGDVQRGIRDVALPLVETLEREGVDLLVSSGDLASHGEEPYYGVVARALDEAGLDVPMLVVPGNHDLQPGGVRDVGPGRRLFESAVGPRRWSTRVGPLLLAGFDDAVGTVEPDDLRWLEAALSAHAGPWLLVCHRPPRRVDREGDPVLEGAERLVALLEARPPAAVVSGHLRHDADRVVAGVRYVVNVSGGDFEKRRWIAPPDFRVVLADVGPAGDVAFRTVAPRRRRSWRTAWRQICVRAWAEARRGAGRVVAAPGAALLALLAAAWPSRQPRPSADRTAP